MISFNSVTSALGLTPRNQAPRSGGRREEQSEPAFLPQDRASLTGASSASSQPTGGSPRPARLDETARQSIMQALPAESQVARLLDSKSAPMTDQQRSACIADLETLNLAGFIKMFDPTTMEYARCGVAEALDIMAQGGRVFYSDGGRQSSQLTQIADLEKLSATARQAALGIVG